ncbi:MAG: hypothetical protein IID48_01565 [Proteobacteria bacterium]|nr:hypothetical protein [Pseudomonadota bacterium]
MPCSKNIAAQPEKMAERGAAKSRALARIGALDAVLEPPRRIRIEAL